MCILFAVFIAACSVDENAKAIYAPNGDLISKSMEDLNDYIANSTGLDSKLITITSINFLEVTTGFFAEILVKNEYSNETFKLLLASSFSLDNGEELKEDLQLNTRGGDVISEITGKLGWCACDSGTEPSTFCEVTGAQLKGGEPRVICKKRGSVCDECVEKID